jgi:single-strand DNA-binding protein
MRKQMSTGLRASCLALRTRRDYFFEHEVAKMAASVNKVILIGNLGRDPETRFTNSGSSVTNFSIATTESFADKAGARQERTEWHNIVVWGKQGEACAQYLKKGSPVYVEGRITYREYEAKDGSGKRKATDIVAMRVQFLSSRGGAPMGDNAGDCGGGAARRAPAGGGGGGDDVAPMDDEDIPF